jgi:hypothetical protein
MSLADGCSGISAAAVALDRRSSLRFDSRRIRCDDPVCRAPSTTHRTKREEHEEFRT